MRTFHFWIIAAVACSAPEGTIGTGASAVVTTPHRASYVPSGSSHDRTEGLTIMSNGDVCGAGNTGSANFASTFPAGTAGWDSKLNQNGETTYSDGFIVCMDANLTTVRKWTYFGSTNGNDRAYTARRHPDGSIIVAGFTEGSNFPKTMGQAFRGDKDIFVAKFTYPGLQRVWARMLGGSVHDNTRNSLSVDASGNIYLGGGTMSFDFLGNTSTYPLDPGDNPTPFAGVVQPTHAGISSPNNDDGVVVKLDTNGHILWATFLGSSGSDTTDGGVIALADGTVMTAGEAGAADFPTYNSPQAFGGADSTWGDGFVARLSSDGHQFVFSRFLGGSAGDVVSYNNGLALDSSGNAVVTGITFSSDFPLGSAPYQSSLHGVNDGFVALIGKTGALLASTYFGGAGKEEPSGIQVGSDGKVYVGGTTWSSDFPVTPNAVQPIFQGGTGETDAFVSVFSKRLDAMPYATFFGGSGVVQGDRVREVSLNAAQDRIYFCGDTDSTSDLAGMPHQHFPVTTGAYDISFATGSQSDGYIGEIDLP